MNDERNNRTISLIGLENFNKLKQSKVLVFGCGGVGGSVIETLARSGIGKIGVVDFDQISLSNLNRQIISNINNIGLNKVDVVEEVEGE